MSETLLFGTKIKDLPRLEKACDQMRKDGLDVEGPRLGTYKNPRSRIERAAQLVRLPNWTQDAGFCLSSDGSLTGEMLADNYSEFFDHRQIDMATGERIDGTGTVHARVASGEKKVGEDGHWGDIAYLERLQQEYSAAPIADFAGQMGGRIVYRETNEAENCLELTIEMP